MSGATSGMAPKYEGEPRGGLHGVGGDADFQQIAHKRLLKLVERAGILVLATHEAPLLRLYCNKVMKMEGGVASEIVDIRKLDQLLAA